MFNFGYICKRIMCSINLISQVTITNQKHFQKMDKFHDIKIRKSPIKYQYFRSIYGLFPTYIFLTKKSRLYNYIQQFVIFC